MSTIEELRHLREREDHVEFKEAKRNYPFAGGQKSDHSERRHCVLGYIVALANERGGRLVLGMSDSYPHNVVGSDFALNKVGELEDEIYKRLQIRIHAEELYEVVDDKKLRVLVIAVPSRPLGKALRFEGVPLMRVGESLREMDDQEYFSIISEQDADYSAHICRELKLDDLDNDAVTEMRRLISTNRNRPSVESVPIASLLSDLRLLTADGLTYAALLLLGKSEKIAQLCPQYNVVVEFRSSHESTRYTARKEFRKPLFIAIKQIWDYLNQPASNSMLHVADMPVIIDVPAFNEETVREAIINACIHRSLQMNGDIFIKQYPDMIEITNPGGFPYGVNRGNILTVNSSPRSRLMAEVVEKTGLIERSGQGVDIMYANCISEGRELPDYSKSDDYQVSLIIRSEIQNPTMLLFVRAVKLEGVALNVFSLLNLYYIQRHLIDDVYEEETKAMLKNGLIAPHAYYKYVLGDGYFANMRPVRNSVCSAHQLSIVYYTIEEHGGEAPISSFSSALNGILTQKQTRNLISKLCQCGFLKSLYSGKNTKYGLSDKQTVH